MGTHRIAARGAVAGLVLGALLLCSCQRGEPAAPGGAWPLTPDVPGVVGYAAARVAGDALAQACRELLAIEAEGLDGSRPVLLVLLDPSVHGGQAALALPVTDGAAFLRSLEASRAWTPERDGRFTLSLEAGSTLGRVRAAVQGVLAGAARGPAAILSAMSAGRVNVSAYATVHAGHAILAPSFEAVAASRALLRAVQGAPPRVYLASLDLLRLQTAYREEIRGWGQQARAALTGSHALGLVTLTGLIRPSGGHGDAGSFPGMRYDRIMLLVELLGLRAVEAVQWSARGAGAVGGDPSPVADAGEDGPDRWRQVLLSHPPDSLRIRYAQGSPQAAVLATMVPAPRVPGAVITGARDPERLPAAAAELLRPLAEHLHGRGAPAEAWLDQLAALVDLWGGRVAIFPEPPGAVLLLRPGATLDREAWARWYEPLETGLEVSTWSLPWDPLVRLPASSRDDPQPSSDATAGDAPRAPAALSWEERPDGRVQCRDASGGILCTAGREGDCLWLLAGDVSEAPSDWCARLVHAPSPAEGPSTRFVIEEAGLELGVRAQGADLLVEVIWPDPLPWER